MGENELGREAKGERELEPDEGRELSGCMDSPVAREVKLAKETLRLEETLVLWETEDRADELRLRVGDVEEEGQRVAEAITESLGKLF